MVGVGLSMHSCNGEVIPVCCPGTAVLQCWSSGSKKCRILLSRHQVVDADATSARIDTKKALEKAKDGCVAAGVAAVVNDGGDAP